MKTVRPKDSEKACSGFETAPRPLKPSLFCCVPVLWLLDVLALGTALYLGYWLRVTSGLFGATYEMGLMRLIPMALISVGWTAIFAMQGLYRRAKVMAGLDQVLSIGKSTTLGFLLLLAISFVWKRNYFAESRLVVGFGWVFSILLPSAVRLGLVRTMLRRRLKHRGGSRRAVVVGPIPFARRFIEESLPSTNGYKVVGFVETREGEIASDLGPEYVLGRMQAIDEIVTTHGVDEIFLPIALLESRGAFEIVSRCSRTGLPVRLVSDIFEILMPDESKERIDGLPPIGLGEPALRGMSLIGKRSVDLLVSGLAVVVFAPLLLLIAVLVKFSSAGPVLFRQIRAGKDGTPFTFYKFRTMRHNIDDTIHREYATSFIGGKELRLRDEKNDKKIFKLPNDPRITRIGRILRRTSLDELPQLFNVIKGDMSLVGPRPPIAYELTIYKEWHKRRLKAKPGITGLWQVSGRSSVPFHDMVLLDIYYINRWSLSLDIEIILKTIPVVLYGKGAY